VGFDGETAEHRRRATIARPHGLLIFLALRCLLYYIRHDESFAPRSMRPPIVAAQVLNVSNIGERRMHAPPIQCQWRRLYNSTNAQTGDNEVQARNSRSNEHLNGMLK
jgi:hypothetical protein